VVVALSALSAVVTFSSPRGVPDGQFGTLMSTSDVAPRFPLWLVAGATTTTFVFFCVRSAWTSASCPARRRRRRW
jgi:hypothetical protein